MTDNAINGSEAKHLFLPASDRSFWTSPGDLALQYLAWGQRDFSRQRIPESQHTGWVCCLIEEGAPSLSVHQSPIPLPAGSLVLIGPDCPFGWSPVEESSCRFRLWMWSELQHEDLTHTNRDRYIMIKLTRSQQTPFRQLHETCRREVLAMDPYTREFLDICRAQFEVQYLRVLQQQPAGDSRQTQIQQAVDWMQEHLNSSEPVARLCDYLNLSQSSLNRLFRTETGRSAAETFHGLKMERASWLLRQRTSPIKEIAYQLGYSHFNDFSRAFKSTYGLSPTQYRRRH